VPPAQGHGLGIAAHGDEAAVVMATALARGFTVNGMELAIEQNQIGVHRVSLVWG
jgi:hypothetical protein